MTRFKSCFATKLLVFSLLLFAQSHAFAADKMGFLENLPGDAMARAKTSNHLILIDFAGAWCPPCRALETKVFDTVEFKKQSQNFIKLKMDVDQVSSFNFRSKYRVNYFPTILFLTPEGREVDRIVGFVPLPEMLATLKKVAKNSTSDEDSLKAQAKKGDRRAMDELGRRAYRRGDYELAMSFLKNSEAEKETYARSELGSLDDKLDETHLASQEKQKLQESKLLVLKNIVEKFTTGPVSVEDRLELISFLGDVTTDKEKDKNNSEAKALAKEALFMSEAFVKMGKPIVQRERTYDLFDYWSFVAQCKEALGDQAGSQLAYAKAADVIRSEMKDENSGGLALTLISILRKAKNYGEAVEVCKKMENKYPKDFTFYFTEGRIRLSQKDFVSAERAGRMAYDRAEGLNRLRAATVLGKALLGLKRKNEAFQLARQTLAETPFPKDDYLRPSYFLDELETISKDAKM